MRHHLVGLEHRPSGSACAHQRPGQLLTVPFGRRGAELVAQRVLVDQSVLVLAEPRVVDQVLATDGLADAPKLGVVAARNEDMAGLGREDVIGREVRVGIAGDCRVLPAEEVVGGMREQERDGGVVKRHVQILAAPGTGPFVERHGDTEGRCHAGADIDKRDAEPRRWPALWPVDAHQAGLGLHNCVISWQTAVRAVRAEARDAAVDQPREAVLEDLLVAEAPFLHRPGLEVLDQDIRGLQ